MFFKIDTISNRITWWAKGKQLDMNYSAGIYKMNYSFNVWKQKKRKFSL